MSIQASPLEMHWQTVKGILIHLASTLEAGLVVQPNLDTPMALRDFVLNLASDLDDRRSTSGFCVFRDPT